MKVPKNILNLGKQIKEGMKDAEDYGTGLVGEQIIVSAWKTLPIEKLEAYRIILNGIIKKKKIMKRIHEQEKNVAVNDPNNVTHVDNPQHDNKQDI